MSINVFSNIGGLIESSLIEPAQKIALAISGNMIPFVAGGITIWVMVYALAVSRGAVQIPVNDFVWRVLKITLILFFGIGGGIFQSDAHGFYSEISNAIYTAISQSSGGTCPIPVSDPMGIYGALDCSVTESLRPLLKAARRVGDLISPVDAGMWDVIANVVSCLFPLILFTIMFVVSVLLATVMIAYMGFEVIALRVSVALAFALSPIFVFSLAFEPIKNLFSNWLNFVIKSIVLQALFVTFMGVVFAANAKFAEKMFEFSIAGGLVESLLTCSMGLDAFCIMMVIFIFVGARIPSLASELCGGGATSAGLGTLLTAAAGRMLGKWTGGKLGSLMNKQGGKMTGNG
jgi:type IV secretion system protein VirB6